MTTIPPDPPDRQSVSPAHPTPLPAYEWAFELWRNNPGLFDISKQIEGKRDEVLPRPASGDIWEALPRGALTTFYWERQECPGVVRDGCWVPLPWDSLAPQAAKLHRRLKRGVDRKPSLAVRPGIYLVPEPLTDLDSAYAIYVIGRRIEDGDLEERPLQHGEIAFDYNRHKRPRAGRYQFWHAWTIGSGVRGGLLHRHWHVNELSSFHGPQDGESNLEAARRLLAEVMGLRDSRGKWGPSSRRPHGLVRGQLVGVQFRPSGGHVPCLVVSPDGYNRQALDVVLVLRCVRGEPSGVFRVPLGDRGASLGFGGNWFVDVTRVRGLTAVSKRIRDAVIRPGPLTRPSPWFDELVELLEHIYNA